MKKCLVVLLLAVTLTLGGCKFSASQFEQYLNAAGPAVTIILQIISVASGQPFNAALAAKVNADIAGQGKLHRDLTSAEASNRSGILGQLNIGFQVLDNDLSTVFALSHVGDSATQTKIAALVGLVQQGVILAEGQLPQQAKAAQQAAEIQLKAKTLKHSFNAVLHAATGNAKVDKATAKMKLR